MSTRAPYRLSRLLADEDADIPALLGVLPMTGTALLDDPLADNARRASFAARALNAYGKATGQSRYEPVDTVLGDLLSDLRHLCDVIGVNFDDAASRSYHYEAEIMGVL